MWIKNKKLIILISSIAAISLLYFSIIIPFAKKWTEQNSQTRQKLALLEKSQAIINQKTTLNESYAAINRKIQAKLPSERGQGNFLTAISEVAKITNIHIESMNPQPLRELGFCNELSVEINMEANLGNLVRFLYQMRKSSVVLVANRLSLQPKSERSALLKGHLVISTIFLKEQP
ncbi:MAG: type 4a pilus biogenesis protein PilO [Candidatus Omnitrophica bacterium]|nr:type 4a pilus biogenesis protein PilO [Candidatus Omnitrophota bacterium]